MKPETSNTQKKQVQLTREGSLTVLMLGAHQIEVDAGKKTVTARCGNDGIEVIAAPEPEDKNARVSIGANFNTVAMNGVSVAETAEGNLVITAPGYKIYSKPAVPPPADADTAFDVMKAHPQQIGDVAEDGWIYIGRASRDGQPLYLAPPHAGTLDFEDAAQAAKDMKAAGNTDCHIASVGEIKQAFNNASKIPNLSFGDYWSSTRTLTQKVKTVTVYENRSLWRFDPHRFVIDKRSPRGKGHMALFIRR